MARKRSAEEALHTSSSSKSTKKVSVEKEERKKQKPEPSKSQKKSGDESGRVIESACGGPFTLTAPEPSRNAQGELLFDGEPEFRPNMTPKEVLQAGSFGGTYFRPIKSSVTGNREVYYYGNF